MTLNLGNRMPTSDHTPETINRLSPADVGLEMRAFVAANDQSLPVAVRDLIRVLWDDRIRLEDKIEGMVSHG